MAFDRQSSIAQLRVVKRATLYLAATRDD